jgi:ABC-type dipeptide/oligopeptide/nickel transport system permease subunit
MNQLTETSSVLMPLADEAKPVSLWRDALRKILRGKATRISLLVVGAYVLMGLLCFTPILDKRIQTPAGGSYQPPVLRLNPLSHALDLVLGADIQGRPVIWRLLYGCRIALIIAVSASVLSISIGSTLGMLAGFFGGWLDELITWLLSTISSVPWILLILALAYALKQYDINEMLIVVLALGLTDWVGLCRLIRGEVLKHRDQDYVMAARALGLGSGRIIFRHILPNVFHLVIITFSLGAVAYVQAEVVLTFLGLGISDKPSWGRMIDDAKVELLKGVWWQAVPATVAILILCLALNILGDALRDALDPKLRT